VNLQCEVEVPGGVVTSGQFTGDVKRGLRESFKANDLLAGSDRNFVTFRVLSGDGRVSFEGVVLWYQEDIQSGQKPQACHHNLWDAGKTSWRTA
jgi:hypothetical protein